MSTNITLLLDEPDAQFRPDAYPVAGTTAAVYPAHPQSGWVIQSSDPRTLRRLAAALNQAADLADKLATRAA